MNRKKTVPLKAVSQKSSKSIKIKAVESERKPAWRFSTTDCGGCFKWPKGEKEELKILAKLHNFDSMPWTGPGGIEGKKHHFLSEESLSKKAKKRLEKLKLEDEIEHLFSFHLKGKERIIAIRHLNIANLLWYDPDHKVSPSRKKHT